MPRDYPLKSDPVAGPFPATLEEVIFPNENAVLDAINEANEQEKRLNDELRSATETAVSAWLREQGIDPGNPPDDWKE